MKLEYSTVVAYLQLIGKVADTEGTFKAEARRLLYELTEVDINDHLLHMQLKPTTEFEMYLVHNVKGAHEINTA